MHNDNWIKRNNSVKNRPPPKKVEGGWKIASFRIKGRWLKRIYKTKREAERIGRRHSSTYQNASPERKLQLRKKWNSE
jgi:hypothetical protein